MIRAATDADLAELYALYKAWEEEGSTPGVYAASAEALRKYLGPFFLVAEEDHQIVGFLMATRQEAQPGQMPDTPQGGPYLEIEELYVRPGFRGRGIGTALMQAFQNAADEHGLEHVYLYSSSRDWRRVIAFYERFGLKFWHVEMSK